MSSVTVHSSVLETAEAIVSAVKEHSYYPEILSVDGRGDGSVAIIDGREFLNFASNDYLGFNTDPRIIEAAIEATRRYGFGSGGSRLTAGTQTLHQQLEERIARFKGTEDAVVFSAGFLANSGIIPALAGLPLKELYRELKAEEGEAASVPSTVIFLDRLVHASIIDGLAVATSKIFGRGVSFHFYGHRDLMSLEMLLQKYPTIPNKLIITDGVFSLHGRIAPLRGLVELAKKYDAQLYVDDAHGTGVFGDNGKGTAEMLGVEDQIDFRVGTLSKALGGSGGFIAGGKELCDYLRIACRTHMFQTSMAPSMAAGLIVGFDLIETEPERRIILAQNSSYVRDELKNLGFNIFDCETQIIPICFYDEQRAKRATEILHEDGIFAPPYYFPAVGKSEAMVRANLTFAHKKEHLDRLIDSLQKAGKATGVI